MVSVEVGGTSWKCLRARVNDGYPTPPGRIFATGLQMPTYEYHCRACGAQFTVRAHISDYGQMAVSCPECRSREVERVMSDFYARTPRKS
jgi:putative FmdB family regulatory protein